MTSLRPISTWGLEHVTITFVFTGKLPDSDTWALGMFSSGHEVPEKISVKREMVGSYESYRSYLETETPATKIEIKEKITWKN